MAANIFIFLIGMANVYYVAMAYIGIMPPFKKNILPILLYSVISYVSKVTFNATPPVHTAVLVISGALLLWIFNKSGFILSSIGALSSLITTTIWGLLILIPIWSKLGYSIPEKPEGWSWIIFNFLEVLVPFLVLVFLRVKKISFQKFISVN